MSKNLGAGRLVWLAWLFATAIGWAFGFGLTWGIAPWFYWGYSYGFYFMSVCLLFVGLFMGIGQWVILRARFSGAWAWIPLTGISLPVGFYVGSYGFMWIIWELAKLNGLPDYAYYIASGCAAGLLAGVFQWLSLRKGLGGLLRWVVVAALSWGIGVAVPWFLLDTYGRQGYNRDWTLLAGLLVVGVLVAGVNAAFVDRCILNAAEPAWQLPR